MVIAYNSAVYPYQGQTKLNKKSYDRAKIIIFL